MVYNEIFFYSHIMQQFAVTSFILKFDFRISCTLFMRAALAHFSPLNRYEHFGTTCFLQFYELFCLKCQTEFSMFGCVWVTF